MSGMMLSLDEHQYDAIERMENGKILCGRVGSGKSRTAIGYYTTQCGGVMMEDDVGDGGYYILLDKFIPIYDLYIITTAQKRDKYEWDLELANVHMSSDPKVSEWTTKVTIDSWNNIGKYKDVKEAFFIFDEQRVVGKGAWVKAFLKIAKVNRWILLSATPGDNWSDYIPVFIANGFFKNRTQFNSEHVVFDPHVNFPRVARYLGENRLSKYRDKILVNMNFIGKAICHHMDIVCEYDMGAYKSIVRSRISPYSGDPIDNASEYCYTLRRAVNEAPERLQRVLELIHKHHRVIIFYNFDYELELLRDLCIWNMIEYKEWNGHKHEALPDSESWAYLVQYTAGAEGWNCISTDTTIFFSQNYSYKIMVQSAGRIDRMNTPYGDLYYYHLVSRAPIDLAIKRALNEKKNFNEKKFVGG